MGLSGFQFARALLGRAAAASSCASRATFGEIFLFEVPRAIARGFAGELRLIWGCYYYCSWLPLKAEHDYCCVVRTSL